MDVRKQLDDFEDHRPYFTYWVTTVQVLILIISLACYGFGPVGMDITHRSGLVSKYKLLSVDFDYSHSSLVSLTFFKKLHIGLIGKLILADTINFKISLAQQDEIIFAESR